MRLPRSLLMLAVLGLGASPLVGQDNFRFVGATFYDNPVAWGARVGPYRGQLLAEPGSPIIDIYCVDYLHFVTTSPWEAAFTGLGFGRSQRHLWV